MIRNLWLDFALFWGIKVPAFITRASLQVPFKGSTSDKAVFACGVATVALGILLKTIY